MLTLKNDTGVGVGTQMLGEDGVDVCPALAVEKIVLTITTADVNRATVTLCCMKTEVKLGEVHWVTKNPLTGNFEQIRHIQFENGHRLQFQTGGDVVYYPEGEAVSVFPVGRGSAYKFRAPPEEPKS